MIETFPDLSGSAGSVTAVELPPARTHNHAQPRVHKARSFSREVHIYRYRPCGTCTCTKCSYSIRAQNISVGRQVNGNGGNAFRSPAPFLMGHGGIANETFCLTTGMLIVQFPPHIGQDVLRGRRPSTLRSKSRVLPAVRSSLNEYCNTHHIAESAECAIAGRLVSAVRAGGYVGYDSSLRRAVPWQAVSCQSGCAWLGRSV